MNARQHRTMRRLLVLLACCSTAAAAAASTVIRPGPSPHNLALADIDVPTINPSDESRTAPVTPLVNFEVNVPPRVLPNTQALTQCSVDLLTRSFAYSYGDPSIIPYSPSALLPARCADPAQWTAIVLTQKSASIGVQFDRLGSVSIGNPNSNGPVEVWRTDNAEPTLTGVTWQTRKDVSQYYSLFKQAGSTIVFDYPNIVDDTYTGALNITLTLTVYQPKTSTKSAATKVEQLHWNANRNAKDHPRRLVDQERSLFPSSPLSERTPDVIFALAGSDKPITQPALSLVGDGVTASSSTTKLPTTLSAFPINAARAFVEVYASGTAQDEFWYANVPSSLVDKVPGAADLGLYGGGPYREVQVRVDGVLAGVILPYAVIFTGGIQPLMWRPQSAFGAYNQPTYLVDITPFIGTLTDGKPHTFDLAVQSADRNGSFPQGWFLSGNVQVVLDSSSERTTGQLLTTPSQSAWLPYPTLTTSGSIKGNLSTDGTLNALVTTQPGADRRLTVVGEVQTGSMKQAARYNWTQQFEYRSDLLLNATVSSSKQTAQGSSILSASPTSASTNANAFPLYAHTFSFPLDTVSAYDGTYFNGSVSHGYTTSLACLDSLLGPFAAPRSGGPHSQARKLGLPLAQSIKMYQYAEAYSKFSESGVTEAAGKTSETYSYADSNLFTFERTTRVDNRTVVEDSVGGTLASQADPVR